MSKAIKVAALAIVFIAVMFLPTSAIAKCNPSACPPYIEDPTYEFQIYIGPPYAHVFTSVLVTYYNGTSETFTANVYELNEPNTLEVLGLGTDGVSARGYGNKTIRRIRGYYQETGGTGWTLSTTPPSFTMTAPPTSGLIFRSVWIEAYEGYPWSTPGNGYFHTVNTTSGCYSVQGIGTHQVNVQRIDPTCLPISVVRGWWSSS